MNSIIVYRAKDCLACQIITEVFSEIIDNIDKDIKLRFIDCKDKEDSLAKAANIVAFPTIIFTKDNNEIARLVGSYPLDYIKQVIDKL